MIEQLNLRAEKGLLLVDWMYPQMIQAAENVVTGQPFDDGEQDSIIWSDFKAKRALKSATKQYQLEYADWQRDVEIFKDIEAAFELAVKGEDSVPNNTVQKDGEIISTYIGGGSVMVSEGVIYVD